ncbi:MAG TPA: UDP-N-acetylglucosamine--N-acetylmuramyl-(pentapeptide) pyrophosphoryl-undecaprenol N-acetylglucosamine transferase [Trueperaceae bacterium]|nr:UDP-N-acetylglucosamine--N-acetylmuramyl-(pentapeptide) pyrophosphoryl-undecaprenol N-acetylglucosamine transferase [Trueperaceae bacterium]
MTAAPRPGRADLVLATGGTGGHVFPALAVAREAEREGLAPVLLGARGGLEERLAAEAGVAFVGVNAGKWHRGRPSPAQALRAAAGLVEATLALKRLRPRVVVGFGGFASFPGAAAAARLRLPLVLHEGNAYPSAVNRWLSRRAALVVVAQEEALAHLKGVRRSVVVPFPVREERLPRDEARAALGLPPDAVVTLVMGGSQGSATLNREAPAAYRGMGPRAPCGRDHHVVHAAGRGRAAEVDAGDLPGYHVHGFVDAATAWSAADLAVTRAGVGTLSEAAFHGVPLVMVPLPSSAEDHQLHNARAVAAAGAGVVVEEREVSGLGSAWRSLLEPRAREAAAAAAAGRTPAGAARRILCAVMELA